MQFIKGLNQLLYFLVELSMFVSLGYAGFQVSTHPYGKYVAAVGLPLVAITLWGIFAAPRSTYRLEPLYRSLFALTLFALTTLLLYRTEHVRLAIFFGVMALTTELLALVLKQ
ncbi:YrdB family protein [Spirosoma utsteinense]|uniref:DUF2568 domain-containing protein n=1 Tax=Spirosoma utsteinense TaxID=2585773 RepID=A0ABR6W1A6_9BACT|nr:YrdB family protein [Spirosoma utsteinense]MBC3785017.1 hypothetical protein [Spirosoma utsteinense]MBC3790374.1 hypothetical protein [Spirosoma utsteinense]